MQGPARCRSPKRTRHKAGQLSNLWTGALRPAFEQQAVPIALVAGGPASAGVDSDPRFREIVRELGL